MSDFSVRSENLDVEQIMRQIRARIREKRGVDYTEDEIRELANVKLEKFIDPKGVRSGLLEEYRRVSTPEPPAPNFAFGEDTLYETHRGPIRWLRSLFRPLLKLLFNPNPLIQALHIQSELNTRNAERAARREQLDALHYEVIHNLVVELTRTGVEVKALKMRLESMASRLDFDERRARSLEGVVQYRAGAVAPLPPPTGQDQGRNDQGRRDQGRRDQGPRNQGGRDQRPRDQGQRNQGPRDQGQRFPQAPPPPQASASPVQQAPFPQAPAPESAVPQSNVPQAMPPQSSGAPPMTTEVNGTHGPGMQGPRDQGHSGNALDADGNERRARRRRRRGRRRPGDRFGGEGSTAGATPTTGEGALVGPSFSSGLADEPRSVEMPDLKIGPTGDRPTAEGSTGDSTAAAAVSPSEPPASAPERFNGGYGVVPPTPQSGDGGPSEG
jgi:hypothetical protein